MIPSRDIWRTVREELRRGPTTAAAIAINTGMRGQYVGGKLCEMKRHGLVIRRKGKWALPPYELPLSYDILYHHKETNVQTSH